MLHVVYRSHGGENRKGRPDWYSKQVGLLSFVRAADRLGPDVEVLYFNDGDIPGDRTALMSRTGEVLRVDAGSNLRSLRRAYKVPGERGWRGADLVLFLEDDYLMRPDALAELVRAAGDHPAADYFALYHEPRQSAPAPATRTEWVPFASTTSTIAVRGDAVLADARLLQLLTWTGGTFDHATCLALQGRPPFQDGTPLRPPPGPATDPPLRRSARWGFLVLTRLLGSAVARRRAAAPRVLLGPAPPVATHMEAALLAEGGDWAALAAQTLAWGRDQAPPHVRAALGQE